MVQEKDVVAVVADPVQDRAELGGKFRNISSPAGTD